MIPLFKKCKGIRRWGRPRRAAQSVKSIGTGTREFTVFDGADQFRGATRTAGSNWRSVLRGIRGPAHHRLQSPRRTIRRRSGITRPLGRVIIRGTQAAILRGIDPVNASAGASWTLRIPTRRSTVRVCHVRRMATQRTRAPGQPERPVSENRQRRAEMIGIFATGGQWMVFVTVARFWNNIRE